MTIGDIQQQAKDLSARQDWANTTIAERVTFLIGEVQELAEEAVLLAAQDNPADQAATRTRLGLEMYDVVWNLCDLANIAGVDLETAFAAKYAINAKRTWPKR
jgi:NTP pyrophosphatase (non-canonical NTP hydrolase)